MRFGLLRTHIFTAIVTISIMVISTVAIAGGGMVAANASPAGTSVSGDDLSILVEQIVSPDDSVRSDAMRAIQLSYYSLKGQDEAQERIEQLLVLLKDSRRSVQYGAASALGLINQGDRVTFLIPELLVQLEDGDPAVREVAGVVLGCMGDAGNSAVPELIRISRHSNPEIRSLVAGLLGTLSWGKPEAWTRLEELEKDGDPGVRASAETALQYAQYIDNERIRGL